VGRTGRSPGSRIDRPPRLPTPKGQWLALAASLLGGGGGVLLIALFVAPYLRKFGGYTVPDFLGERFGGTGVRPLAVLAVILCSFPALALALMGLGAIGLAG